MSEVVIVDYGMGNLRSVQKAFSRIGADTMISSDPKIIRNASKLVLPGVGHFGNAAGKLKEMGIRTALNDAVIADKTPILGICLGMQLMAARSEEGVAEGLGWFDADVTRFRIKNANKYKVPHIAWNSIDVKTDNFLLADIPDGTLFYFVHSFHIQCHDPKNIIATTEYEYEFTSAIHKDNIFGTQFHPEKSHDWGEKLLANFLKLS